MWLVHPCVDDGDDEDGDDGGGVDDDGGGHSPLPSTALCVLRKVRCHCIFSGPGIRYSDIFFVSAYSKQLGQIYVQ